MNAKEIKELIKKSFHEKNNSHAFLLVTNNIDKCLNDVIDIIKYINCEKNGNDECNICTSIDAKTNPDVIFIEPEGKEIKTESIINLMKKFSTKPLINKYSTYVIRDADKMNASSSNKILKFLEEPDENVIGFFITEKVQGILPTIRSRCEIYNYQIFAESILDLLELTEIEYDLIYNKTIDLINKLNDYPKYMLLLESKKNSELERNEVDLLLKTLKKMYTIKYESIVSDKYNNLDYASVILNSITTNDLNIIVKRIKILDNMLDDFKYNLNKELMFNTLFLKWE